MNGGDKFAQSILLFSDFLPKEPELGRKNNALVLQDVKIQLQSRETMNQYEEKWGMEEKKALISTYLSIRPRESSI
jgi:hypothetical protein